jgi:hypothetical protein
VLPQSHRTGFVEMHMQLIQLGLVD